MGILDWSRTAAQNAVVGGAIAAADGASARSFPGSLRELMAALRRLADAQGGALVTTGTGNDYRVTTGLAVNELRSGVCLTFRANRDNTSAPFLAVDATGSQPILLEDGTSPDVGFVKKDRFYTVVWNDQTDAWSVVTGSFSAAIDAVRGGAASGVTLGSLGASVAAKLDTIAAPALIKGQIDLVYAGNEGVSQSRNSVDNRTILQDIVDTLATKGKGKIILPRTTNDGTIGIDQFIYWRDGISIEGSGRETTHLRNTSAVEPFTGGGRVFDVGNRNPTDILTEPAYSILPIVAGPGSTTVELVSAGDAAMFAPGDVVWAYSSAERAGLIALQFAWNDIASISGKVITLSRPWSANVGGANPVLSKSSGTQLVSGRARRSVKNASFRYMTCSTAAPAAWVTAAGGHYNCLFEDLRWMGRAGIFTNASAFSRYIGLDCDFHDRPIEWGVYSSDNLVKDFIGRFVERGLAHQGEPLVSFNENSNRNSVITSKIFGDASPEANAIAFIFGSENTIYDFDYYVRGLTGSLITVAAGTGHICVNNAARNGRIYQAASASSSNLIRVAPSKLATEGNNSFSDLEFFGTQITAEAVRLENSTGTVIRRVSSERGGYLILPGTKSPVIDGLTATVSRKMTKTSTLTKSVTGAVDNGSGGIRLTSTAHGFSTGETVRVTAVPGVPAASGSWIITAINADTFDLQGSTFAGAYTSGPGQVQWSARMKVSGLQDLSSIDLGSVERLRGQITGIASSDPANLVEGIVVPIETLIVGDEIGIDISALFAGTAGIKTVNVRLNDTVVASLVCPAGQSGPGRLRARIQTLSETGSKVVLANAELGTTALALQRNLVTINTNTTPLRVGVYAYTAAGDTITLDSVRFTPLRAGSL